MSFWGPRPHAEKGSLRTHHRQFRPVTIWAPRSNPGSAPANLHSIGVFLDLSKAFDMLNHDVLICKLERYGIRGTAKDWFESYLSNHTLICKVKTSSNKTTYSAPFDVMYGTAQGSCLGPLLFISLCHSVNGDFCGHSRFVLWHENLTTFVS